MRKILFSGISDGKVGSGKCGFCEHCYALPKGVPYFDLDGITFCEDCILSSDYNEEEVKLVKKDKKWHILPDPDELLDTVHFNNKDIRILQTFKINLKDKKSVPNEFKLSLRNSQNKVLSEKIVPMDQLVPEFLEFVYSNKLVFNEEEFKKENEETFKAAFHSTEPYFKSKKNNYLNELMDILEDYCLHNEKHHKEIKDIYTKTMESFSSGKQKILDEKIIPSFLEYHFEKISEGWPEHVKKDFKKWNIFKKEKDAVIVDLNKHSLMWGTYLSNGECDLDFRYEYDGHYEWEDEVKYLDDYFNRSENQYNQCQDFFNRIGIDVSKKDNKLLFKIKQK